MKALTSTMIYTEEQSERSTKTPAGNVLDLTLDKAIKIGQNFEYSREQLKSMGKNKQ